MFNWELLTLNNAQLAGDHPFKLTKNRSNLDQNLYILFHKLCDKSVELYTKSYCVCTDCELF